MKGVFIVIDGPRGSGKSTILENLNMVGIQERGFSLEFTTTKEFGNSPLVQAIRSVNNHVYGFALAHLICANRVHHLNTVVIPALNQGKNIIMERYFLSSLVYQRLDGLSVGQIWDMQRKWLLEPDLTVLVKAPAKVLESRIATRADGDRFVENTSRTEELTLYSEAALWARKRSWPMIEIDSSEIAAEEAALLILNKVQLIIDQRDSWIGESNKGTN